MIVAGRDQKCNSRKYESIFITFSRSKSCIGCYSLVSTLFNNNRSLYFIAAVLVECVASCSLSWRWLWIKSVSHSPPINDRTQSYTKKKKKNPEISVLFVEKEKNQSNPL